MSEYAMAGNIWSAPILRDYVAWPRENKEAEDVDGMNPGDLLIPKFAGSPLTKPEHNLPQFEQFAKDIGIDADQAIEEYGTTIQGGQAALAFLLRVVRRDQDFTALDMPWARVVVDKIPLEFPLETKEFLRLRALPDDIALQFKGMVGKGHHFELVPNGTGAAALDAGSRGNRGTHLRQYSLVEAPGAEAALEVLRAEGRSQEPGDQVLIVTPERVLGIHGFEPEQEGLIYLEGKSSRSPAEIRRLFEEAILRNHKDFSTMMARKAINEIFDFLESESSLLAIDDYRGFYDPYRMLTRRINQALEIRKLPIPGGPAPPEPEEVEEEEEEEIEAIGPEALEGLDIESVRNALPEGFELDDSVLADAVTALRSGKHLLLSGPPGTGKSTLAEALCRAVVKNQFRVATATADWTTFDTIGGYMPSENNQLHFEPGIVLRCLRDAGEWLVLDEINRADIDKAFGPLFTVLAGTADTPQQDIELPFQQDKKGLKIEWAESATEATGEFVVTPQWRLLGTLNSSDKASLFQLSFAFLRRFALVEVPLPAQEAYQAWFKGKLSDVEEPVREQIATAAITLARIEERELGPAILGDIAGFIGKALLETSSGPPAYADPREAFLAGVRLFAVAQYEGAREARVNQAMKAITDVWPDPPEPQWSALKTALKEVSLA